MTDELRIFKVGQRWTNRAGAEVEIVDRSPVDMLVEVRRMALRNQAPATTCIYKLNGEGRRNTNHELDLMDIVEKAN